MKKVLIITYYWPPAGGIGVQRWLQFSKNFRDNGWEPIIFTAKDANYAIIDEKLLDEVPDDIEIHKVKVPEPNNIISLLKGKKNNSKSILNLQQQSNINKSTFKRLLWTIRGNFFIPDARMFWIRKSFKYLDKYLSLNKVDAIISTGPPHSTHIIAEKIIKKHRIPWISDFRDPWTSMDYLKQMNLKRFAMNKHKRLEESVLRNSTEVVVVGKTIQREFKTNYNIDSHLIYNGYNANEKSIEKVELDDKFTIVHTGSFLHHRNCNDLWKVLSELVEEREEFSKNLEIKLVGNVASVVLDSIEKYGLNKYLNLISYVDHYKAKTIQRNAQLLLLPIDRIENAEFVLTGKLFEYLQAKRPILFIGPSHGDAADVIQSCDAGSIIDFDDVGLLKEILIDKFTKYTNQNNICESKNIEQFSYTELTKKITELLEKSTHD